MKYKKTFTFLMISLIISALVLYTLIITDVSYDAGFIDGGITMYLAMDSVYILIPKSDLKQKPQPYKNFEDNMSVKLFLIKQRIHPINCHNDSPNIYGKCDYFCWNPTE